MKAKISILEKFAYLFTGIGFVVMIYVSMMYATTSLGLYCMDIAFVLGSLAILLMLFRAWPKKVDTNA